MWTDLGAADDLAKQPLQQIALGRTKLAVSAEDMERNVSYVKHTIELHDAGRALVTRAVDAAHFLITHSEDEALAGHHEPLVRAGRKASMHEVKQELHEG
jgi:hypothetical protein